MTFSRNAADFLLLNSSPSSTPKSVVEIVGIVLRTVPHARVTPRLPVRAEERHVHIVDEVVVKLIGPGGYPRRGHQRQQQRVARQDQGRERSLEARRLPDNQESNEVSDGNGLQSAAQLDQIRRAERYRFT